MNSNTLPFSSLIILGAGGHAKVLLELAQALNITISGVCDPTLAESMVPSWRGIPVLGGDKVLDEIDPAKVGLINGIGQLVDSNFRCQIYESLASKGFIFPPLIHPAAWVSPSTLLTDGVQIKAGVVIQADCQIGKNTIVNTRASIDHDSVIGAHVHVAPGATLCGSVRVHDSCYIGTGSAIFQGVTVGKGAVVGGGVTLSRDLEPGHILISAESRKKMSIK